MLLVSLLLVFLFLPQDLCGDIENINYHLSLDIQHSFDNGVSFTNRGTIKTHSINGNEASIDQLKISEIEITQLRKVCEDDGLYLLKIVSKINSMIAHRTAMNACVLYENGLRDLLTFHLDWRGNLVAVSAAAEIPAFGEQFVSHDAFHTRIEFQLMENGPQPDTTAFIQKLENEKAAKERGETVDNRSFLAKYWMYIVPLVIILAISSGGSEPSQGSR